MIKYKDFQPYEELTPRQKNLYAARKKAKKKEKIAMRSENANTE